MGLNGVPTTLFTDYAFYLRCSGTPNRAGPRRMRHRTSAATARAQLNAASPCHNGVNPAPPTSRHSIDCPRNYFGAPSVRFGGEHKRSLQIDIRAAGVTRPQYATAPPSLTMRLGTFHRRVYTAAARADLDRPNRISPVFANGDRLHQPRQLPSDGQSREFPYPERSTLTAVRFTARYHLPRDADVLRQCIPSLAGDDVWAK